MAIPHLSFLCRCICCEDLGPNGLNSKHSLEEQLLHLAFTTSTLAPVRWARLWLGWLSRQANLPLHGGWHRTRIRCQRPWNVKSRMRKARSSPTQTWIAWGKLVQLRSFTFLQCTSSIYDSVTISIHGKLVAVPQSWFLCSRICCKDLGSNGLNNKHSLEEQLSNLAFTTSAVAPVRWVRLGWLSRQANLPLHGGWHRTRIRCQRPWNVKSTMRKARSSPTQTRIAWGKLVQLRSFTFLQCTSSIYDSVTISIHGKLVAVPQSWFLCSRICCKDLGSNGLNNKHSLEEQLSNLAFTTSAVAPVRWVRLGWLPRQANLPLHGGWHRTPQLKPASPGENWYKFAASLFCNAQALFMTQWPFQSMVSW